MARFCLFMTILQLSVTRCLSADWQLFAYIYFQLSTISCEPEKLSSVWESAIHRMENRNCQSNPSFWLSTTDFYLTLSQSIAESNYQALFLSAETAVSNYYFMNIPQLLKLFLSLASRLQEISYLNFYRNQNGPLLAVCAFYCFFKFYPFNLSAKLISLSSVSKITA